MKRRIINSLIGVALMLSSCESNVSNEPQVLDLKSQRIGITSVHNARQLGGYRIGDKCVKADLLLRSAKLANLSLEDSTLLSDKFKVQRIYDFRSQEEILSDPDVIPGQATHLALSLSFTDGVEGEGQFNIDYKNQEKIIALLLQNAEHPSIQAMCTGMYDLIFFEESSQQVYRQFFADLLTLDPADGAILWHCTQGKDRAGCASAMLLAALGADRSLIVADYTLSKEYYDPMAMRIPTTTEVQRNVINTLISANPTIFEATLDKVDQQYGSLTNYLTQCIGLTPDMMQLLRDRYLE